LKKLLYPLRFKPLYLEKPWGGRRLASDLNREIPPHLKIGESWEIADRGMNSTLVAEGEFQGQNLHWLITSLGVLLLGEEVIRRSPRRFPLLYKILDVGSLLSLQVHPPDDYARLHEHEEGKTELWYFLEAAAGAAVISGLRPGGREAFERLLRKGRPEKAVGRLPARAGRSFLIPPGRVHALAPSCLLVEIQTNSDLTYRIHDWGRKLPDGSQRPLHWDRALEVIDYADRGAEPIEGVRQSVEAGGLTLLRSGPPFGVELLEVERTWRDECRGERFVVLTGVGGKGSVSLSSQPGRVWKIERGEFLLLPAYLGEYRIHPSPSLNLLRSYPE